MADIDTKVLYLETPSVSAPPAAYTIGVRMKNVGIHNRSTAGYVQVFRKATGLLEKTYIMASAVIEPDEEKQAFSTETWDLSEEVPGTEFILAGMITSDDDQIPSNDILNPTTVTVVDEPPPPPPPVASHASQHEDGGSDELSIEGLHGTPADPQEFASHAAKHMTGGDDEIDVTNLDGLLLDPQIPTDHANERHSSAFALDADLTSHENDATPHNDALALPVVVQAGEAPSMGPSTNLAPRMHEHGGHGGLDWNIVGPLVQPGPDTILDAVIADGCLHVDELAFDRAVIRCEVHGDLTDAPGPGSTVTVDLLGGPDAPGLILRQSVTLPFTAPATAGHFRVLFTAGLAGGGVVTAGHGIIVQVGASSTVAPALSTTGPISFTDAQTWRVRLSIVGTATVSEVMAHTVLETIVKSGP